MLARGAGDQQPAIVGAEVERGIGLAITRVGFALVPDGALDAVAAQRVGAEGEIVGRPEPRLVTLAGSLFVYVAAAAGTRISFNVRRNIGRRV